MFSLCVYVCMCVCVCVCAHEMIDVQAAMPIVKAMETIDCQINTFNETSRVTVS